MIDQRQLSRDLYGAYQSVYRQPVESSRLPRVYVLFLTVALLQFGLSVLAIHTHLVPAAAGIYALVLWRLGRGGLVAWMLLLVENLFTAFAALALIGNGTGVLWGHLALTAIPDIAMVLLLLSAPMRRHVGLARSPQSTQVPQT